MSPGFVVISGRCALGLHGDWRALIGPGVLQSASSEEDQEMTANDIGATTQLIYILHTAANNLRQVNEQTKTAAVTCG